MYKVTFESTAEKVSTEAEHLLDAFNKLKITVPKVLKGKLTVDNGQKQYIKVFNMKKIRLFSANEIFRSTWAKLIESAFYGTRKT